MPLPIAIEITEFTIEVISRMHVSIIPAGSEHNGRILKRAKKIKTATLISLTRLTAKCLGKNSFLIRDMVLLTEGERFSVTGIDNANNEIQLTSLGAPQSNFKLQNKTMAICIGSCQMEGQ